MNVNCPYCEAEQEINHDDGYGYEEDQIHEQQCVACEKYFTYCTYISFSYDVAKADCLNGSPHKYKATNTYPIEYTKMECEMCGCKRECTDEEMKQVIKSRSK